MIGSLFTGISGLSSNAQSMQVIGDNIANVNTTGFKVNRSLFGDIISQAIEGGAFRNLAMGRGVTLMATNPLWTQGSLETTGRSTDLAISGRGLFVVGQRDESGETVRILYTRDGSFSFDKDGYLVNAMGYVMKGYKISEQEQQVIPTMTDIYIPAGASPPKVTTKIETHLNLNAASSGGVQAYGAWKDPNVGGGDVSDPNADLYFTAVATGTAGNGLAINLEYDNTLTEPVISVDLDNKEITVKFKQGTHTAKDLEEAINSHAVAGGMVVAKVGGDGSGYVQLYSNPSQNVVTLSGGGQPKAATLTQKFGTGSTAGYLQFTAKEAGSAGNAVTIKVEEGGTNPPTIVVENSKITIKIDNTVTVDDIATAITNNPSASALVDVEARGNTTALASAKEIVSLTGGLDNYPDIYSATITVYDSIGNPIELTLDFTCLEPGKWEWKASVPQGIGVTTSTGVIQFDSSGNLDVAKSGGGNPVITIDLLTGAQTPLFVTWEYVDEKGGSNGTITGFGTPSALTFQSQDGYAAGMITNVSVDEKGVISGVYSNGRMVPLYQIVLADFPSYAGLDRVGNNMFAESIASGQPTYGVAQSGILGNITPGALEMSNVDLAEQFVKMITTQRAFQANARVVTTSDDILQELMMIKR